MRTRGGSPSFRPIVGRHPTILEVQRLARQAAKSDLPVLITGETGTGKELLAGAIHVSSSRREGPFAVVDCGILSQEVARSELFGHLRGAFTGATDNRCGVVKHADGGTLLLDEVGDLAPDLQLQLLRFVQEGEFRPIGEARMRSADVRLVAATNRNLNREVLEGRFRQDLFYRLNVLHLHLPPLRDRRSDIPILIQHFKRDCRDKGLEDRPFTPDTMRRLVSYPWPGNVRELSHAISTTLLLSDGESVTPKDLPDHIFDEGDDTPDEIFSYPYKEARRRSLKWFTREYLHRALLCASGNVSQAARDSGIGRQYFQVRMAEHGIRASEYRRRT